MITSIMLLTMLNASFETEKINTITTTNYETTSTKTITMVDDSENQMVWEVSEY